MTPNAGYGILAGLVVIVLAWLHGRSTGKNAAAIQQSNDDLKRVVQKIGSESNTEVADDLTKHAE